jgi:hypothetical protein
MIAVRCTGACLGLAQSQRSRLVLAPEDLLVRALRDLSQRCTYEPGILNTMHGGV